jgi:tight adherence protein C
MQPANPEILTTILTMGSVVLWGAFAWFLGVGIYNNLLGQFVADLREDRASGVGAGSLAVRRIGSVNRRLMWPGYESRRRRDLIRAGEPKGYKPEDIMAMQEIGFVFGLLFGLLLLNALGQNLLWAFVVGLVGLIYPLLWLRDQVKKRHHLITRALPYNLDLLTLSVEAGLDFTAALAKVVEKGKPGPLRDELQLVLKQLKMGKTREEALKSLVARVDLTSLNVFVTALIQADKMGTSLGKVLRIQSTQLRIDRTQRAEKLAGEAPVKMLFPLVACIFPTVFMVLFGPIVFALLYGNVGG